MLHLERFGMAMWGGCKIRLSGVGYAHDLFLDSYDEAGILALVMLILFIIRSAWVLLRMVTENRIAFSVRLMLLAMYASFYLEFAVEPILQGIPWFFVCFCFIHGMAEYLCYDVKSLPESVKVSLEEEAASASA